MIELYKVMPQIGRVDWIGLRPARRESVKSVADAEIETESGLVGDRFNGKPGSNRMVTLIQAEHLDLIATILKKDKIDPKELRRNIVVSGINLLAMKAPGCDLKFRVGNAILKMTGNCHPCSRME